MKTKKICASALIFVAIILASQSGWSQQPKFSWEFQEAVWGGNVEAVRKIINQNPGWVNDYRFSSNPPLVEATQHGKLEIVEFLVTNKTDINAKGTFGRTALHIAANNGDSKMVEFLLKHKADVNIKDDDGLVPIIQSIKSVEVIKLLLAYGADINAHGGRNTLYSQAVGNPQSVGPGVIQYILTNGVDVTVSGDEGFFQAMMFENETNLVKMLVPYYVKSTNSSAMRLVRGALEFELNQNRDIMASAMLSVCSEFQTNSLQKAVALGDEKVIRCILETNSASVNQRDFFGWTPLHLAAISGKTKIAEFLLSSQAEVDAQDDISNSPLHWAAFFGYEDLVKLLLQHKANMDLAGNSQSEDDFFSEATPLDFVIRRGFTSVAVCLITNGANLGSCKPYLETPLHIAAGKENVELVKLLISHGANVNAPTRKGGKSSQSPLDIAVGRNSPETVRLLISNGASLQTQMQAHSGGSTTLFHLWAEGSGNTNIAARLLTAGCDLNTTNHDGQVPLHIAVEKRNQESVFWLLSHEANVNAKDKKGETPLHLIVTSGNTNLIQRLLDYKADVNATDNNGKTPLALFEDLKIQEANWGHGWLMGVDVKAVENLLVKSGAKGPILSPPTDAGMHGF